MASAKQIAWRKKFAKMAKSGKFKKAKRTSRTVKTGKMKGWDVEITGTSYAKKSNPHPKKKRSEFVKDYPSQESGGILQRDNYWHVLIHGKEYVVHLNPKDFEKFGYSVGDEISIDAELELFFHAMDDAKFSFTERDEMADMSKMNKTLNPKTISESSLRERDWVSR